MRKLTQLSVPQNEDTAEFPDGGIRNETSVSQGTPVVEEVYGDVLTNMYRLIREARLTANGLQDNTTNGYQLISALKRLPNNLNDIVQPMSLSDTVWQIPLELELFPNNYFVLVTAADNFNSTTTYTFRGSNPGSLSFSSDGFRTGDKLLLIITSSSVESINLTSRGNGNTHDVTGNFTLNLANNNDTLIIAETDINVTIDPNTVYPDNYSIFIQVEAGRSGQIDADPSIIQNTNDLNLPSDTTSLLYFSSPMNGWYLNK